jgi:multidrug resistance protein MdtO
MATIAQTLPQSSGLLTWIREFLKQELAPYPGRATLVARMTVAATLVMIVCMTFRIPFAFQGAVFTLLISRQNSRATLQSGAVIFVATAIGAAYLLASACIVISFPLLHFLWVIGSFWLAFYAISAIRDYALTVNFAIMIAVGVPFWDRQVPAETNVEDILRLCLSVLIGVATTAAVELVCARLRPGDEIFLPIIERFAAVENLLTCYAEGHAADAATKEKILRLGVLGTSMLRRSLRRSDYLPQFSVEMGGVAALAGRLVDLAATLTQLDFDRSANDQRRFRNLASTLATIRVHLMSREIPGSIQFDMDAQPKGVPLIAEMEHTVRLIPQAFAGSLSIHEYLPSTDDLPRATFLAPDAFVNPEHVHFALKGCLAASSCYVIYNAIAWPGISTAVTTCLLTALTTIGSSHQKQILRICGAIVGGFILGMGAQIFILPSLDSITGFVVLFVAVTALSSWFMTSSPRLSYFGFQVALAFYLINLTEFKMQVSLAVARNRVVGILLGLFMMWLVFDRLWGASAAVVMKRTFISNLRSLGEFAREPLSQHVKTAAARGIALRETINSNLDKVRALADGVLLELGPSREQDLALRDRLLEWQPNFRILFITRIVLWRYRIQLPGFELPEGIQPAQEEFDNRLATALDGMADRMEGNGSTQKTDLTSAYAQLEQAAWRALPKEQLQLPPRIDTLLVLSHRIASLADSLEKEI